MSPVRLVDGAAEAAAQTRLDAAAMELKQGEAVLPVNLWLRESFARAGYYVGAEAATAPWIYSTEWKGTLP